MLLADDAFAISDPYGLMVGRAVAVVQLNVRQGQVGEGLSNLYRVDVEKIYRGHVSEVERDEIACACDLKTGGSYLAFLYEFEGKPYIRGAYEIRAADDEQVRVMGHSGAIVLVEDASNSHRHPLFLIHEDPQRYDARIVVTGKLHKVPVNGWYPLDVVIRDIRRRRGDD